MENIILIPIPISQLLDGFRDIIKQELDARENRKGETLLSPAEACKVFSPEISKVTLARWTKEGIIPSQRIGGRVFYKQSDITTAGATLKRYKATRNL